MNYTKPEVAVLGQAVRVIEMTRLKINGTQYDGVTKGVPNPLFNPAYDLDE